jgi:hypothetical protein
MALGFSGKGYICCDISESADQASDDTTRVVGVKVLSDSCRPNGLFVWRLGRCLRSSYSPCSLLLCQSSNVDIESGWMLREYESCRRSRIRRAPARGSVTNPLIEARYCSHLAISSGKA